MWCGQPSQSGAKKKVLFWYALRCVYKFHPMNPNKKPTYSKPILFIDWYEKKVYKQG
jgi:hypothetical protein